MWAQVERTDQIDFRNYDVIRVRVRVGVRLASKNNLVRSFYLIRSVLSATSRPNEADGGCEMLFLATVEVAT